MNIKLQSALLDIKRDFDKIETPSMDDLKAMFDELQQAVDSGHTLKKSRVSKKLAAMLVKWRVENM